MSYQQTAVGDGDGLTMTQVAAAAAHKVFPHTGSPLLPSPDLARPP